MNPGTFYLYEYENNKRRRNVGFIKTARHYRSCILQIHAAGIPAGNGASLELYAFFLSGQDLIAEQIAVLNCFRRNISARLPIAENSFPRGALSRRSTGSSSACPGTGTRFSGWLRTCSLTWISAGCGSRPGSRPAQISAQPGQRNSLPGPKLWSVPRRRSNPMHQDLLRGRPTQSHQALPRRRTGLTHRHSLIPRTLPWRCNSPIHRPLPQSRTSLPQKRSGVRTLPVSPGNSGRLQTTASCSTVTTITAISC